MRKQLGSKGKRTALLAALCLVSAGPLRAGRQTDFVLAPTWVYDLLSFDVPGAEYTSAEGINNHNEITGTFSDGPVGRIFVIADGVLNQFAWPDANSTVALDINDAGTLVGYFQLIGRTYALKVADGNMSVVPYPAAFSGLLLRDANASGINNQGQIAGWFRRGESPLDSFGTLYSYLDGSYSPKNIFLSDVNDLSHVVGTDLRVPADGIYRGFLFGDGIETTIAQPGAAQTDPDAVNNLDTVVGHYVEPFATGSRGFVWTKGKYASIDYPGAVSTSVTGINDAGIVVGHYTAGIGTHGFVGIPRSPVNVLVNGGDGPLTLDRTQPLRVELAFKAPPSGALDPAELYAGVATATQVWWLDSTGAFLTTPTPTFAGMLPEFGPSPLIELPNTSALEPGTYTWFVIVDDDADGAPNGVFYDVAQVTLR